jgi:hypothetical protein
MTKYKTLIVLFLIGLFACNTSDKKHKRNLEVKDTTLTHDTSKSDTPSKKLVTDSILLTPIPAKKKKVERIKTPQEITDVVLIDETNYIIPGFVRNTFSQNNKELNFTRKVKYDEDRRIGCSGGGNELSFSINNTSETFLVENEMLKTLNFKYNIEGGIYYEYGEAPYKGKISGILLSDNTWQIEINVWITMKDMHNKDIVRQIILNDKFTGTSLHK